MSTKLNKTILKRKFNKKYILMFLVVILCIILLTKFKFCIVKSSSMSPTIEIGDIAIFVTGNWTELKREEIVAFSYEGEEYGKRIIGLPGESIRFLDGYVYVNNQRLDESAYLSEEVDSNCVEEFNVPLDCYFVLGDNRVDSDDSRFFQDPYIPKDHIILKHIATIKTSKFIR